MRKSNQSSGSRFQFTCPLSANRFDRHVDFADQRDLPRRKALTAGAAWSSESVVE